MATEAVVRIEAVSYTHLDVYKRQTSSRQAGPVSQKQIRQCEHDIEFGSLLFEPSVSRFPKPQLFFNDTKYVLYLRTDRRFCVFRFLGRVLAAFTQFL